MEGPVEGVTPFDQPVGAVFPTVHLKPGEVPTSKDGILCYAGATFRWAAASVRAKTVAELNNYVLKIKQNFKKNCNVQ